MTNSPDLNEITVNAAILRVHIKDVKAQVIYELETRLLITVSTAALNTLVKML